MQKNQFPILFIGSIKIEWNSSADDTRFENGTRSIKTLIDANPTRNYIHVQVLQECVQIQTRDIALQFSYSFPT